MGRASLCTAFRPQGTSRDSGFPNSDFHPAKLEPAGSVWKRLGMLILASQSPIRKALLDRAGIAATVVPARVNERQVEAVALGENASPPRLAQILAEAKAAAVAGEAVIGADQVLELNGTILHKPEDTEAARRRLDQLKGRTHLLHSG